MTDHNFGTTDRYNRTYVNVPAYRSGFLVSFVLFRISGRSIFFWIRFLFYLGLKIKVSDFDHSQTLCRNQDIFCRASGTRDQSDAKFGSFIRTRTIHGAGIAGAQSIFKFHWHAFEPSLNNWIAKYQQNPKNRGDKVKLAYAKCTSYLILSDSSVSFVLFRISGRSIFLNIFPFLHIFAIFFSYLPVGFLAGTRVGDAGHARTSLGSTNEIALQPPHTFSNEILKSLPTFLFFWALRIDDPILEWAGFGASIDQLLRSSHFCLVTCI